MIKKRAIFPMRRLKLTAGDAAQTTIQYQKPFVPRNFAEQNIGVVCLPWHPDCPLPSLHLLLSVRNFCLSSSFKVHFRFLEIGKSTRKWSSDISKRQDKQLHWWNPWAPIFKTPLSPIRDFHYWKFLTQHFTVWKSLSIAKRCPSGNVWCSKLYLCDLFVKYLVSILVFFLFTSDRCKLTCLYDKAEDHLIISTFILEIWLHVYWDMLDK